MALTTNQLVVGMFNMAAGGYKTLVGDYMTANGATATADVLLAASGLNPQFMGTNLLSNTDFASGLIGRVLSGVSSSIQSSIATIVSNYMTANPTLTRGAVVVAVLEAVLAVPTTDATLGTAVSSFTSKVALADASTSTSTDFTELATVVGQQPTTTGQTYALTTGADIITGTSGNDTITGVRAATASAATDTLTAADSSIDGGTGTDTLTVTSTAANTDATGGAIINNIEIVNLRQTGAGVDLALDASKISGISQANNYLSTGTVTVTNLGTGDTLGLVGNGSIALGATTGSYSATVAAATISIAGGTGETAAGAVEVLDGAAIKSVTINSDTATNKVNGIAFGVTGAGTADAVTSVVINSAGKLTTGGITGITNDSTNNTITVSGAGASVDLGTLDTDVDTVTASGMTAGGVVVTLSAAAQAVTGGAGADRVNTAALGITKSLDGGAGTDVIEFTAATNYAATAAKATNFETLRAGGNGDSYNFGLISGATAIEAETSAGAVTFTNVGAATPVTVIGNITGALGLTLASTSGTSDAIAVTLDNDATTATNVTVGALTSAGVETFNVVSGDALASGTANIISALTGSTSVKTINVSGTSDLTITDASAATALTLIDASSFAKILSVTGAVAGSTIKGGSGNDAFSVAFGNLGTTTGFVGGTGDDTLTVSGNGSDLIDGDFASISGIDNLTVTSATSTSVTLGGHANTAVGTVDANSDGRLDFTAVALTTGSTIDAAGLTSKGIDIVVTSTNAGLVANVVTGGAINDTITYTQVGAFATTGALTGGTGLDVITISSNAAGVETVITTATTLANGEIVTGFTTGTDKYDYNGSITAGAAVTGGTAHATLTGAVTADATEGTYAVTTDIADAGSNTQGSAFSAVLGSSASTLATNFASLTTQLIASGGAFNGTISGLDAAVANGESALLILDNGTGSIVMRFVNDTTTANTVTASELELVGVFTNAVVAVGDLI